VWHEDYEKELEERIEQMAREAWKEEHKLKTAQAARAKTAKEEELAETAEELRLRKQLESIEDNLAKRKE